MRISEIFYSIDGEGKRCGQPAIFIRTVGCNLKCPWCDTKYSWGNGDETAKDMTVDEIMQEIKKYPTKNITLTGGEPLIANGIHDLIRELDYEDYDINIETNGAVDIKPFLFYSHIFFTLDYKALSSGQNDKMIMSNYKYLSDMDCVKCVVSNEEDMIDFVNKMRAAYDINAALKFIPLYISPVFGEIDPLDIVDFVMHKAPQDYKFVVHLQMHKILWDKNKRGV